MNYPLNFDTGCSEHHYQSHQLCCEDINVTKIWQCIWQYSSNSIKSFTLALSRYQYLKPHGLNIDLIFINSLSMLKSIWIQMVIHVKVNWENSKLKRLISYDTKFKWSRNFFVCFFERKKKGDSYAKNRCYFLNYMSHLICNINYF